MFGQLSAIWRFRSFILTAVKGEFRARVTRSRIGAVWFVIHPLAMALIYVLILSEVLGAKLGGIEQKGAYAVFLVSGIAAWSIFSEVLMRCLTVFIEYGSTLKKINFPRICLPAIVVSGALINQFLLLSCILVIVGFYGFVPSVYWLALIPLMFFTAFLALGMGVVLGVMNVFTRDVGQVMMVLTNMWFWLTPIVYSLEMIPEQMAVALAVNPLTPVVGAYQDVILHGRLPDVVALVYPALLACGFFALSMYVFRRASPELVDAL